MYEIRKHGPDEHRPGYLEIYINGMPTDYMTDPTQHLEKVIARQLASGQKADPHQVAEQIAVHSLNRIIHRLQSGSMIPGGIPLSPTGDLDDTKIHAPKRNEREATHHFLNRGRLKGLSFTERELVRRKRSEKRNVEAEWKERRLALIKAREQELKDLGDTTGKPKLERRAVALRNEIAALKAPVLAASHGFQYAFGQYLQAAINFVSDDIRIAPLMTNTTADTERDAIDTNSDFTTPDEFDGANYSTGGLALDNQAVNIDDANDRAEVDADDETVTALGAGTRSIQGVLLMKFVTNFGASIPLHWLEFSTNKTPDGSNFTFQFNAEGILQATG